MPTTDQTNEVNTIEFANPGWLWLLAILLPMTAYYAYCLRNGQAAMRISSVEGLRKVPRGARYYLRHLPFAARCAAVALLVAALARPQSSSSDTSSTTEGIDIVLSLDISGSMLARDFKPDRISAAKQVAGNFIADRPNDRIGLVVFAGESFTQSPLTTDKASLLNILGTVQSGVVEDGTAIGNGLGTAINRLRESKAESKVVILLTDGVNNRGQIAPQTAADIAGTLGIRVYTIGVGSEGTAPYPAIDVWGNVSFVPMKVEIDEKTLTEIAEKTGGKYFRATDNEKLREIYKEIDRLEKSRVEVEHVTRHEERFGGFALAAMLLLVAEFLMRRIWLRRIP